MKDTWRWRMFTGLVEELGTVKSVERRGDSLALVVSCRTVLGGTRIGDSIAVNGVCLTVTGIGPDYFRADIMPETLRKTSLAEEMPGNRVNLERPLSLGGRLGGHLVSGHIDAVGVIKRKTHEGNAIVLEIASPAELKGSVVPKGSVAVDGVSLTVVSRTAGGFVVSLIPHTAKATTLGSKIPGDRVNLEADMIAKYVAMLLQQYSAPTKGNPAGDGDDGGTRGIDVEFLSEHGFSSGR